MAQGFVDQTVRSFLGDHVFDNRGARDSFVGEVHSRYQLSRDYPWILQKDFRNMWAVLPSGTFRRTWNCAHYGQIRGPWRFVWWVERSPWRLHAPGCSHQRLGFFCSRAGNCRKLEAMLEGSEDLLPLHFRLFVVRWVGFCARPLSGDAGQCSYSTRGFDAAFGDVDFWCTEDSGFWGRVRCPCFQHSSVFKLFQPSVKIPLREEASSIPWANFGNFNIR